MGSLILHAAMLCQLISVSVFSPGRPAGAAESDAGVWEPRAVATTQATPLPPQTVWFRAWLKVPDNLVGAGPDGPDLWRDSMTLTLRDLPGPIAVFLNGREIITTRDVRAEQPQRFKVPKGILEQDAYNALVL